MNRIGLEEITQVHLARLIEVLELDPQGTTIEELLKAVASEYTQLFEDGDVLFVLGISGTTKRKLMIQYLIGTGMLDRVEELKEKLIELARAQDCTSVGGVTSSRALCGLYVKLGAKEILREYELEI